MKTSPRTRFAVRPKQHWIFGSVASSVQHHREATHQERRMEFLVLAIEPFVLRESHRTVDIDRES